MLPASACPGFGEKVLWSFMLLRSRQIQGEWLSASASSQQVRFRTLDWPFLFSSPLFYYQGGLEWSFPKLRTHVYSCTPQIPQCTEQMRMGFLWLEGWEEGRPPGHLLGLCSLPSILHLWAGIWTWAWWLSQWKYLNSSFPFLFELNLSLIILSTKEETILSLLEPNYSVLSEWLKNIF